MTELYRTGFTGGAVQESIDWMVAQSAGAKRICVPFTGIGRSIVAMARPDTIIESWDTMAYARYIIDGVFRAKEVKTNVDGLHYRKGYAFEHRPFKNMDDRSAGFIDWVAQEGTDYDKACLGSAICRSTLMARMMHWKSNVEGLYTRFQRQFEYNQDWLNQPGEYIHHEGNFFNWLPAAPGYTCDLVEIDPPKVINYSDTYSLRFQQFNDCLIQEHVTLPKWTRRNSIGFFRQAMQVPAPKVIFMYVSGVYPPYDVVKRVLEEFGEITEEQEFYHQGRTDYGLVITK
jgi:hypothetical protein